MPRMIAIEDEACASLAEVADSLSEKGFDPGDEDSLNHAATLLRRLGNDRTFLGDLLIDELAKRHRHEPGPALYGPQVVMLVPPQGEFFLRANIWPSADEHMVRASGEEAFAIGLPHDHNFNFLTLGYFGPGYWSDYYEYDYEEVVGWRGEPVPSLRFIERSHLAEGKMMLYRAHIDVHAQLPADSLSVSLNIMHVQGGQGWMDQYQFDLETATVVSVLGPPPIESFLRTAVGLGSDGALDLAERFARSHPSDRMRLTAWKALAAREPDPAECDRIWARAEASGNRLVEAEARRYRMELAG